MRENGFDQAELILADSSDNTEYITTTVENGIAESGNSSEEDFLSILIVEDNRELRSLLRNILSKKYTILEAANGEEGLKLASEAIPDMIISDVMMPVMDDLEKKVNSIFLPIQNTVLSKSEF